MTRGYSEIFLDQFGHLCSVFLQAFSPSNLCEETDIKHTFIQPFLRRGNERSLNTIYIPEDNIFKILESQFQASSSRH